MRSKPVAALLIDLEVAKTHNRPHVSDDNPYSESQFKTLKYRPDFPERFGSIEDARVHCQQFFHWYNHEHRHGGIGLMAPVAVHDGTAAALTAQRALTLDAAYAAHPMRFKGRAPKPPSLPSAAWINPPADHRRDLNREADSRSMLPCEGVPTPRGMCRSPLLDLPARSIFAAAQQKPSSSSFQATTRREAPSCSLISDTQVFQSD